jgi:hypothetical protein
VPAFARWAEVEVNALAEQMQGVLSQIGAARQRAAQARDRILAEFSWRRVATTLIAALGDFERQREATISARHFSKDSDTRISVVIPTLNRPAELIKTPEAYENQTLTKDKWEIVVSDDGSSYNVADQVAPFAERLRLQVINSPEQTGAGEARNRALMRARGELILFGGDDIVPLEENRSWNELYGLRALLMYNQQFEIFFVNDYFARFKRDLIHATFPMFLKNTGGSLWLRK